MRRILLTLFVLFILFFSNTSYISAQTITPVPTIDPSIFSTTPPTGSGSCGQIGSACCQPFIPPTGRLTPPSIGIPGLSTVIDAMFSWMNSLIALTDPIVKPITDLISQIRGDQVCSEGIPSNEADLTKCTCLSRESFNIAKLCTTMKNDTEKKSCISCSDHGIWTAIGCVDFKLDTFIKDTVFGFGVGLAGLIALLCIIYSAIMMQTSQGNAETIKKAQENLTSCILGLILIIFSVLILRIIGVDILRIPGFN